LYRTLSAPSIASRVPLIDSDWGIDYT
jgi:hypothetical protein